VLLVPSPKSQFQLVTLPVVVLLKVTANGVVPLVGVIVKFATGAVGALTAMGVLAVLVLLPPGPVAVSLTV
jgi:hypothetical protein